MKLIRVRDNDWINPDKVLYVRFDSTKQLTRIHFGPTENESIVVNLPPDQVVQALQQ